MADLAVQDKYWIGRLSVEYSDRMASWSDIRKQMPLLYEAAAAREEPVVAELGTRTGQSTSAFLYGASWSGGHVWSVDVNPVIVPPWWYETGLWSFLACDDLSREALRWLPGVIDVLFTDTSHRYEHTLDELRVYGPRVRSGGIILCHDVELRHDDVRSMGVKWVEEASQGPEYPVAAALDTYCAETGLTWERQPVPAIIPEDEPFYGLGTILIP